MGLAKRTFALAAAGAVTAFTGPGAFYGIHVRENTGVAAPGTLQIYDNTAAAGTLVDDYLPNALPCLRWMTSSEYLIPLPL